MKQTKNRKRVGRKTLEDLIKRHGYEDYSWMNPKNIVVSQWVRMKCTFGCRLYGKGGACPPNVPSVPECKAFFDGYKSVVLFHFPKRVEKPEDRHAWTKEVNSKLLKLEREVFLSGYYKTFLLFMDSCELCESCPGERAKCLNPKQSRPSPESMAIDVFATVRKLGYPIKVLKDYSEEMNRYAFLLIE
jgi:predicted metal-binding protein